MKIKERVIGILEELKAVALIAAAIIGIMFVIALIVGLMVPYPEMSAEVTRYTAFNRACEAWKNMYNCSDSMYTEPFLYYQDPYNEDKRVYSINELCRLLWLNIETCYMRCNCTYTET